MTHPTPVLRGSATVMSRRDAPVDVIVALVFVVSFAFVMHAFQYRDAFAESDIYRVLVGILDGANSGSGIASKLHYDNTFGIGYLSAFYAFAAPATLRDPDRLTGLINDVGFWSMMAGLVFFWCAVSIAHGTRAGVVALIVFALAPTIAELGTSGHPVIPMFALVCAAATLLFLPVTGWHAVVAAIGGGVLLLAGLTMRGDVFLAFPWLVLTRIDTRSLRGFIVSGLVRSIAPLAALIVFFVLQHLIVLHQVGPVLGEYFGGWVRISFIAGNAMFIPLGFGIATTAVAAVAAVWLAVRARPGDDGRGQDGMAQFLGPAALTLVPLVFFVAIQGPSSSLHDDVCRTEHPARRLADRYPGDAPICRAGRGSAADRRKPSAGRSSAAAGPGRKRCPVTAPPNLDRLPDGDARAVGFLLETSRCARAPAGAVAG